MQKACTTPSGWNWEADDGRIKETFCGSVSHQCVTSGQTAHEWAQYGYYTTGFLAAVGISQSFCNTARFRYWEKHYDGFPSYGITVRLRKDEQLPPRTFFAHHRSNSGDTSYKARVEHVSGPQIARIAFSIHRGSLRPPWWPNLPSGW